MWSTAVVDGNHRLLEGLLDECDLSLVNAALAERSLACRLSLAVFLQCVCPAHVAEQQPLVLQLVMHPRHHLARVEADRPLDGVQQLLLRQDVVRRRAALHLSEDLLDLVHDRLRVRPEEDAVLDGGLQRRGAAVAVVVELHDEAAVIVVARHFVEEVHEVRRHAAKVDGSEEWLRAPAVGVTDILVVEREALVEEVQHQRR
mmetsp:Transcript_11828/g.47744  ORF Transcript_11828/g.47744 Transcript_11828/m.47744 type:complete len:202 (+) Transcript_11828:2322-2927(+)